MMPTSLLAFFIGTYTSPGGSEGIYSALLNLNTGELTQKRLFSKLQNPSYVAHRGQVIYSVSEKEGGEIWGFDMKGEEINHQPTGGDYPCHVSFDKDQLFVANYNKGTVARFQLSAKGELQASTLFTNTGKGPNARRQDASHTHFAQTFGGFTFVCDLGTDELIALNNEDWTKSVRHKLQGGSGPRHAAFSPKNNFIFITNELDCTVESINFSFRHLLFAPVSRLSTLPVDAERKGASTAEIRVLPSGKFVYVTNRGHNSIASYSVDQRGALKLVEITPAGVKTPRGMNIDPSGNWLLVAGQEDNVINSFRINPKTGKLKPSGFSLSVNKPVDICF